MRLRVLLGKLLPPVVGAAEDMSNKVHSEVKEKAAEVLELLRRRVKTSDYVAAYQKLKEQQKAVRASRKRKAALEAVADPELTASKRISKNLGKRQSKQRKLGVMKRQRESSGSIGLSKRRR